MVRPLVEQIASVLDQRRAADLSIAFTRGRVAAQIAEIVHPVITTVEELKAIETTPELCAGALIKCNGVPSFGAVFELNDDGTWNNFDEKDGGRTAVEDVPLPATLIWHPYWWTKLANGADQ